MAHPQAHAGAAPAAGRPGVGIFPQFFAKGKETLVLREKVLSLTGDSFDIQTASGQPIFKIKGRKMTISGRKTLTDVQDNHLFDIVKEKLHIHTTYVAEDPKGNKIMEVKSSFKLVGSEATIQFKSNDGREHELTMSGNWRDTSAKIVDKKTGTPVATIDRQYFNKREIFGGQQTYALIVEPGVDMALMVAACVALDEKNNED